MARLHQDGEDYCNVYVNILVFINSLLQKTRHVERYTSIVRNPKNLFISV